MALNTNTVQTLGKHSESKNRNKQKVTKYKLASVIPSSSYITDPFKGTKQTTSTPYTRKLEAVYVQDLSPIPLNASFGADGQPPANKILNFEKLHAVKRLSTQKSESREPGGESYAVGVSDSKVHRQR
jgi:hypothetical protein